MQDDSLSGLVRNRRQVRLETFVRLRWLAITGQSVAVVGAQFGLGLSLPFGWCFLVIAASSWLNLALRIRFPASYRLSDESAALLLAFDILQLAALLFLTGGLQNPFSLLFLAPVLISATALPPERTLSLGLLAVGLSTILALVHRPLPWFADGRIELPFLYVSGVWTAILLGTAFTGVYAWRVAEETRQLSQALAATELVLAREQHLSQLDGLAAAAAHELGTPLGTIMVITKELVRQLGPNAPPGLAEDLNLLREQADRCRSILSKLTSLGSDEAGFLATVTFSHIVEELVAPQRSLGPSIDVSTAGEGPEPVCRRNPGVMFGLANILDNAADFAESRVVVRARWTSDSVSIEVRDDGPGFPNEVLLRAGEPYVTTRAPQSQREGDAAGAGLGLGLFIAKTLIERSGAQMSLSNAAGTGVSGAIVKVVWSRSAFERGASPATLPEMASRQPLTVPPVAPI
ncbi:MULTISPECIES: ActS/PrrB/RegB family redox-sensitive histidine kinase [Methylobacterium]|uniref:histidine kinase n=2 Tax=Pseudomonadota TaxID=1224 RepID=A0ABQ4T3H5_9HYPH|nr:MULTISPECIES: ActS/PrrB/RegB family redox-sensitive histidine kinase [Methylobacterium]PIU05649.1 MAG: two-component sensor histidine kinase [Methylobacterium sp. CG09_land_8_20_14_0_10_71_15]PIU12437.1 MAG: two-component sensor histidine kinase [Methylobacterium sp. CG08_land_8_20_14_0_20_71_15]GBU19780.1 ATPase [Methylobacterium sp.]GJE08823.1 Sensor histidine kinase RegB [Methylobacterium jeotgali]